MMFSALPASPPFFFRDRYSGNEASSLGFSNISARGGGGGGGGGRHRLIFFGQMAQATAR